jgi:hypothetical protein
MACVNCHIDNQRHLHLYLVKYPEDIYLYAFFTVGVTVLTSSAISFTYEFHLV